MTKVYLVKAFKPNSDCMYVSEVFTNKRKAENYIKLMNEIMEGYNYFLDEREICQVDYKELPFM